MAPTTSPGGIPLPHQSTARPSGGNVFERLAEISEAESDSTPVTSSGSALVDKIDAADPVEDLPTETKPNEPRDATKVEAAPAEEVSEEAPAEGQEEPQAAEGDQAEETPLEIPTIKAVDGSEIPENVEFVKKVDGKDVKITLKDLLDDFSGKTAVKSRFSEINTQKQKLEVREKKVAADLAKTSSVVNRFLEAAKAGHQRDAMDALCELTGADPEKTWNEQQNAVKAQQEKYFSMTPEEQFVHEKSQEAEYWKRKAEGSKTKESSDLETVQATDKKIQEASKTYGVSRGEMTVAHNYLLDLVDKGVYDKSSITVETVASEALNIKLWGQIDGFTRENLPEKSGDTQFYREVLNDTRQYGITEAQWRGLLKELKSSKPKNKVVTSKLAEKVAKTKPFTKQSQVTKSKTVVEDNDYISFDEI